MRPSVQLIVFGKTGSAVTVPGAPVLTLLSAPSVNTPSFTIVGDLAVGDVVRFQKATDVAFATAVDITNTISAPQDAANELDLTSGALADGAWWFRVRTERGATISAWSNVVTETIATATNTWNNADKSANIGLSGLSNLTLTDNAGAYANVRATNSASSGKKYWELHVDAAPSTTGLVIGIANAAASLTQFVGNDTNGMGWAGDGRVILSGAVVTTIQGYVASNTLCFSYNIDISKIWFRTNGGNWNNDVIGNQNPATNTGGISTAGMAAGPYFAIGEGLNINDAFTANFGATAYAQTPPSGFGNW